MKEKPASSTPQLETIDNFAGAVISSADPTYDETRAVWNAMHDKRPALIARCTSAHDVVAAIAHARRHGLPIAVRCGGHSLPGNGTIDDGLVIDLRPMNDVTVDPVARRATAGGGALLGDVDRATQEHGLAVPAGVVSHTGLGGLTLGGGIGRLMRRYGLTIDSLVSAEVVTASGEIVRASADEHPDLFWALRGGGGNFGVVTRFEFELHDISVLPILFLFSPLDRARQVLERARAAMADPAAPDELLWTNILRLAPPLPWIPDELVGRPGVVAQIEWSGDIEAGERLLADLRDELRPPAFALERVPYLVIQTAIDEPFEAGNFSYGKNGFIGHPSDALLDVLVEQGGKVLSPLDQLEMLPMGGAITRVASEATAFPFRDARWLINAAAVWAPDGPAEAEIEWVRQTYARVEPHLTGGAYVNFMDEEPAAASVAYGRTLQRLQTIKATYDPDNVFRRNQNIAPAG